MRTKLFFLTGSVVLALTSNAIAGQGESFIDSVKNPVSVAVRPSSTPTWKKNYADEFTKPWELKGHLITGVFGFNLSYTKVDSIFGDDTTNSYSQYGGALNRDKNPDMSDAYAYQFRNIIDHSGGIGESTYYFNCPVDAVPEADEWLLMLFGFGLVIIIAALRSQKLTFI